MELPASVKPYVPKWLTLLFLAVIAVMVIVTVLR